jgi:hypothetical protein
MPSLAALTIYAFGVTAFAAGIFHLQSPTSAVNSLGLPEFCIPAANGIFNLTSWYSNPNSKARQLSCGHRYGNLLYPFRGPGESNVLLFNYPYAVIDEHDFLDSGWRMEGC